MNICFLRKGIEDDIGSQMGDGWDWVSRPLASVLFGVHVDWGQELQPRERWYKDGGGARRLHADRLSQQSRLNRGFQFGRKCIWPWLNHV